VAGEPGIGKSTLVEDFIVDQEQAGLPCHIARGRCSERLAGTEAYLPLLDALENLVRGPDNSALARLLKNVAPLWHAQIAPSTSIVGSKTKPIATGGSRSQERLKRELVAFVEEATRAQPLVLFLDDVHWADVSTVDLLSYLASRCAALPLLVVVTFRPEELLRDNHPFLRVKQDLQARGCCRELRLEFLTAAEVAAYLEIEFPDHRLPSRFVKLIHDKTEGNPLFMVDVLRYLRDRGVLAKAKGRWTLTQTVPDIARALPESVRGMIERKIDGLEDADRRLLVTASVQGYEFDGVVVARLLRLDPGDVEERLAGLERIHGFVRTVGEVEYPDRTLTLRYRFVHVLYQNLLYSTLTPSRRVALSKAVGDALEGFYRDKTAEMVSELAVLFEAAREFSRAAEYFHLAAKKAAGVFAYEEALMLGRRALGMLRALPDTPQSRRRELDVLMVMGVPATATRGYANREVQEIYDRASALCVEFHETGQLALALWRLFAVNVVRLQLETAHEIADRLRHLPHEGRDPSLIVQGELALGLVAHYRGEFQASADHCERTIRLCTADLRRSMCATLGYDPMVSSYDYLGHARACLGYPDAALQAVEVALQAAGELGHPYTLAHSLHLASVVCSWRGDWEKLREYVGRLLAVATKEGFSYFSASAVCFDGIRLAQEGRPDEALARMQEGWEGLRAIEGGVSLRRFASDFAEQLARAGRLEEGLDLLDAELAMTGSARFWDAELVRVRGELLMMRGSAPDLAEAEGCFERALDIARQQHAKSFELRAATSLARLWHAHGKSQKAAAILSPSYGWFTEGFETTDLREARTLLAATKQESSSEARRL
jgi:tetratricopeptide (TPR) repeat protein